MDTEEECSGASAIPGVQCGGRPIVFDRFHAARLGGKAVDMLLDGRNNAVVVLQSARGGLSTGSLPRARARSARRDARRGTLVASRYSSDSGSMSTASVAVDLLQDDARQAVGALLQALLRDRRASAPAPARSGGGVGAAAAGGWPARRAVPPSRLLPQRKSARAEAVLGAARLRAALSLDDLKFSLQDRTQGSNSPFLSGMPVSAVKAMAHKPVQADRRVAGSRP